MTRELERRQPPHFDRPLTDGETPSSDTAESTTADEGVQFTRKFHFKVGRRGCKRVEVGMAPKQPPRGNIPRVSRLMALAIRFDQIIRDGVVPDQAELAHLGHVTRARITQIMNLLNLAPDIQEALLFLPRTERGRDPLFEKDLRPIAAEPDWSRQRRLWKQHRRCRSSNKRC